MRVLHSISVPRRTQSVWVPGLPPSPWVIGLCWSIGKHLVIAARQQSWHYFVNYVSFPAGVFISGMFCLPCVDFIPPGHGPHFPFCLELLPNKYWKIIWKTDLVHLVRIHLQKLTMPQVFFSLVSYKLIWSKVLTCPASPSIRGTWTKDSWLLRIWECQILRIFKIRSNHLF